MTNLKTGRFFWLRYNQSFTLLLFRSESYCVPSFDRDVAQRGPALWNRLTWRISSRSFATFDRFLVFRNTQNCVRAVTETLQFVGNSRGGAAFLGRPCRTILHS